MPPISNPPTTRRHPAWGSSFFRLFGLFIRKGLDFIVRLVVSRSLIHWNATRLAEDIARSHPLKHAQNVTFKSCGKEVSVPVEYGPLPVRLAEHPDVPLHLVVVRWPRGDKSMMLLTTLEAVRSRRRLRQVVEGYLTRWRIEETIRFVKQAYELEDVRLLRFSRLKSLLAIVSGVAYFATTWLGQRDRLSVLADHIKRMSRRMFEVPGFFYAIADGVGRLFARRGRWHGLDGSDEAEETCQKEPVL